MANKKVKYLESRNQSILWYLTRYHEKFLCHRQNVRGYLTPPTFWKVGVVLLGIIFCNTELNKTHFLCDEMIFIHCSLQIKQNIYSIGIFCAPVVTQFIIITTVIAFIEISYSDWSRMVIWSHWPVFHFSMTRSVFMRGGAIHDRTAFVILCNASMN